VKTKTSRYNVGGLPIRIQDPATRDPRPFPLHGPATLYDGAARPIGRITSEFVVLNDGAVKVLRVEGARQECYWAHRAGPGSGWIPRTALVDPPKFHRDPHERNPRPPRLSRRTLRIDGAEGRRQLAGLYYQNSRSEFPNGGNQGTHFAGRHPGESDYVYLLFAVPNVVRGGGAKDSLPDGSNFVRGLDERGSEIREVVTMYRGKDLSQAVDVTFLYGRAPRSRLYGWMARANVGAL
jgi:hypothetical protein